MRDNGAAILPIGMVNLITGANKDFGTVWECWEEGHGTNMLVDFGGGKLRIVHTAGATGDPVGTHQKYCHDQTNRAYGFGTTLAVASHTKDGLKSLSEVAKKKSLVMATYK